MTVGELIDRLKNYHDNTIVLVPTELGYDSILHIREDRAIKGYYNQDPENRVGSYEIDKNNGVPCVVLW